MLALSIVLETVKTLQMRKKQINHGDRICQGCHEEKPAVDFFRSRQRVDGYDPYCKVCRKEYVTRYKKSNPAGMRLMWSKDKRRRRKLLKSDVPYLSIKDFDALQTKFGGRCAYCGEERELYQDHFYPIGSRSGHNAIIPACEECNSSKGNQDFKDWYYSQSFYSSLRESAIMEVIP